MKPTHEYFGTFRIIVHSITFPNDKKLNMIGAIFFIMDNYIISATLCGVIFSKVNDQVELEHNH